MRTGIAALTIFAMACGGGEGGAGQQQAAAADAPAAAAPAGAAGEATGTVHEVRMHQTDAGSYVYEPASLTIQLGDAVRWINVNGFPHNVAFYADRIPAGAAERLASLMPAEGRLSDLSSRLMMQPNETVEITFLDVPTGEYNYFCTPHEALGMVAVLTVEQ